MNRTISVLWWGFFVATMGIILWLLLKPWIVAEWRKMEGLL